MTGLDDIRDRWAKATPGPWTDAYGSGIDGGEHDATEVVTSTCEPCGWSGCSGSRVVISDADRAAITAAPEDVARLFAEVDALRASIAPARRYVDDVGECPECGHGSLPGEDEHDWAAHKGCTLGPILAAAEAPR